MSLETRLNRALFAARLLEDLVHRPDGWTAQWGPYEVPARVVPMEDGVAVEADFPDVCHLAPVTGPMVLKHLGEPRSVREIEHPGDGGFEVRLEIAAETVLAG